MMFIADTISAQVEPVPGKKGWFQLTGRKILRWHGEVAGLLPWENQGVVKNPRIKGIHDYDEEIELRDPRFNHENQLHDDPTFAVFKERDGTYTMALAVNRAEFVLLRFLCPHEAGAEGDDPIGDYRIEPPVKATTVPKVKAPVKKVVAKKVVAKNVVAKKASKPKATK